MNFKKHITVILVLCILNTLLSVGTLIAVCIKGNDDLAAPPASGETSESPSGVTTEPPSGGTTEPPSGGTTEPPSGVTAEAPGGSETPTRESWTFPPDDVTPEPPVFSDPITDTIN